MYCVVGVGYILDCAVTGVLSFIFQTRKVWMFEVHKKIVSKNSNILVPQICSLDGQNGLIARCLLQSMAALLSGYYTNLHSSM